MYMKTAALSKIEKKKTICLHNTRKKKNPHK